MHRHYGALAVSPHDGLERFRILCPPLKRCSPLEDPCCTRERSGWLRQWWRRCGWLRQWWFTIAGRAVIVAVKRVCRDAIIIAACHRSEDGWLYSVNVERPFHSLVHALAEEESKLAHPRPFLRKKWRRPANVAVPSWSIMFQSYYWHSTTTTIIPNQDS